ncbi:MAG: helicase, partial [Deltaproteobacteria bacterium]|nr:helicase [Deltaproteobacteria bacterium]
FPTEQGADVNKSREVASNKMFMIHNTLGEDSKIFDIDETPTPAALFSAIQRNPEAGEEESYQTTLRRLYYSIKDKQPELIEKINNYPPRIKAAKKSNSPSLLVFTKKGRNFFVRGMLNEEASIQDVTFGDVIPYIECTPETKAERLSDKFWDNYERIKTHKLAFKAKTSEASIEVKARNLLKDLTGHPRQGLEHHLPFLRMLLEDLFDYKTLSDNTLRRIASLAKKEPEELDEEIRRLEMLLGKGYLDKTKQSLQKLDQEVIIAIENQP